MYGRPDGVSANDEPDSRVDVRLTRGVDSRSLSTLSYGLTSAVSAAARRPDVALVMNVANGFYLPALKARGVATVVNVDGIEWERAKWGRAAKAVFRGGARATAQFADELVFDAHTIGDYWRENFSRDGVFIPYGGTAPAGELPVESGLQRGNYVLYVARFVPENSVAEFFEAVPLLASKTDVVIVGSTGYGGEFDVRARDLDATYEHVHWLGHVSDDARIASLWQHCGAYFHGHTVGGTNPALVQAMAAGAPTVARDTVYNREVLGEAGTYVGGTPSAIAAALLTTLADPGPERVRVARRRVETVYNWDAVCAAYDEVLTKWVKR